MGWITPKSNEFWSGLQGRGSRIKKKIIKDQKKNICRDQKKIISIKKTPGTFFLNWCLLFISCLIIITLFPTSHKNHPPELSSRLVGYVSSFPGKPLFEPQAVLALVPAQTWSVAVMGVLVVTREGNLGIFPETNRHTGVSSKKTTTSTSTS